MSDQGGLPDLSGMISRIAENPQAIMMLSSLLGGGAKSVPSEEKHEDIVSEKKEEKKEVPVFLPQKHGRLDERRRLLIALKPFLSKERKEALETLLIILDAVSLLPSRKEPPCI